MSRGSGRARVWRPGRRDLLRGLLLLAGGLRAIPARARDRLQMMPVDETFAVLDPFHTSPFPYDGMDPERGVPFLDVVKGGRRGHNSPRGGIYWEDTTYSERRVLLGFPAGFDLRRPAAIVVFFHGNGATLEADVLGRQRVLEQLDDSGLNAVLVAPQFAVDALDSSAGRFWLPGAFSHFLREAAVRLAELYPDPDEARAVFDRLPVVLVAYSGGYDPAAFALAVGGAGRRFIGVILLDAVYGQTAKFVSWVDRNRARAFFVSAYTRSSAAGNAAIRSGLAARDVGFTQRVPRVLDPGAVVFLDAGDARHEDFVTDAWVHLPLASLLARIPRFPRRSVGMPGRVSGSVAQ